MSQRDAVRLTAIAVLFAAAFAPGAAGAASVTDRASGWLVERQDASGAFGSASQPADQVAEAVAALSVAGGHDAAVERALGYLERAGRARASEQAAYAARIVIGLVAAGEDPRDFAGTDFVALISSKYNPVLATHGGNIYAEGIAGIGREVAGDTLPAAFVDRLVAARCPQGGWGWQDRCGRPPDADTTSVVLATLALAGVDRSSAAITDALEWLRQIQDSSGAFPLEHGMSPNANSTGLVAVTLETLGIDPGSFGSGDLVRALEGFRTSEGALAYTVGGTPNLYATVQGLPGLVGAAHPFARAVVARAPKPVARTTSATRPSREPTTSASPPSGVRESGRTPVAAVPDPSATPTDEGTVIAASATDTEPERGVAPIVLAGVLGVAAAGASTSLAIRRRLEARR